MNPVKKTQKPYKSLVWDLNRKGMEKWSKFLGNKKHPWRAKVTSGHCGKPENSLFGQCIIVYGKQTGSCVRKERSPNTAFNWIRTMSVGINEWNTCDCFFQIFKETGIILLKAKGWPCQIELVFQSDQRNSVVKYLPSVLSCIWEKGWHSLPFMIS